MKTIALPKLIPSSAIYHTYAVRSATFGGAEVKVLAEKIGGDYPTREKAEEAGRTSELPYQVIHMGGRS